MFNSVINLELSGEEGYVERKEKKTNALSLPKWLIWHSTSYLTIHFTSLVRNATFVIYYFLKHKNLSVFFSVIYLFILQNKTY